MDRVSDLYELKMPSLLVFTFPLDVCGGHCFESLCVSSSLDVEPIISCSHTIFIQFKMCCGTCSSEVEVTCYGD